MKSSCAQFSNANSLSQIRCTTGISWSSSLNCTASQSQRHSYFTANQFVFASNPLRPTTWDLFTQIEPLR
jgi:hypothetical protein